MTTKVQKTVQGIQKKLRHVSSRKYVIAGVLAFATIGTILLVSSHAATPTANFEAEAGARSGNASSVGDANASGGNAVKFSASSTRPVNCAPVPSTCGYPDATNTGPPDGTVFTKVPSQLSSGSGWSFQNGSLRVTGNGVTLSGLDVAGNILIDAANVTVENSIVTACGPESTDIIMLRGGRPQDGYNASSPTIRNNILKCSTAGTRARSNVRDPYGTVPNTLVVGNEMTGAGNCVTLEGAGTARDNWCHDLGHVSGDHHSGFSNHGGASDVKFIHNTALLANTSTSGGGGLSGAITIYGDFARAQNVTVDDKLISGGAYTVYGGINNETTYGNPLNINIINNRFLCNSWIYGPGFIRSTTTWTGNYCDQTLANVSA